MVNGERHCVGYECVCLHVWLVVYMFEGLAHVDVDQAPRVLVVCMSLTPVAFGGWMRTGVALALAASSFAGAKDEAPAAAVQQCACCLSRHMHMVMCLFLCSLRTKRLSIPCSAPECCMDADRRQALLAMSQ
jgi:hypothetical protein